VAASNNTETNSGGRTRMRGEARRRQLVELALHAFGAQGYRGTTLAGIAAEAGISEPGVIHHFANKERLLRRVLDEYHADSVAQITRLLPDRSLAYALVELAREHEADPASVRMFMAIAAESVDPEHPAHEWFVDRYRRTRAAFTEVIAEEQRAGRIKASADPGVLARQLTAVFDGLQLQYLLDPEDADIVTPLAAFLEPWGVDRDVA
jgi:AcrR family transcriptional regulator